MDHLEQLLLIGAGPTGLAVARALKDGGVPYDHVEADNNVGGNWYHGVYETAHIISSRNTTQYADYPMPATYPDFPSRQQLVDYFNDYADRFGLRPLIRFNVKVTWVRPVEDNRWEVSFSNGETARYKGVVICNGHHWDKRFPSYPGQFSGEWWHSKDYKRPDQLKDKRVLVIGGGNSACDIASEAARVSPESHISLRRGYWFLPKTLFGRPAVEVMKGWVPVPIQRWLVRLSLWLTVGDYREYGLPLPDHRVFDHHPTVNSELLHYIKHGRIQPHPDVARFEGRDVHFVDGRKITVDTIVCATGFNVSVPFLSPGILSVEGSNNALLYGGCLSRDYRHLYVVGTTQPRYGLGPLVTPFAHLLVDLVKLQDACAHPLANVLHAMGQRPPPTHLVDPHGALRQMKLARLFLPRLVPGADRKLARRTPPVANPVHPAPATVNASIQVY